MDNQYNQQTNNFSNNKFDEMAFSEELVHQAIDFLKHLQQPEACPEGVVLPKDELAGPDLYTLLESLISLRSEISLQGRSFHQLEQTLKQFMESIQLPKDREDDLLSIDQRLEEIRSSIQSQSRQSLQTERKAGQEEGRRETFTKLIEPLLDTHDQLRRLEEQNLRRIQQSRSWLSFIFKKDRNQEFLQLVTLSLKKMNQRLNTLNVIPVARYGMEFDPSTMKAIETEVTDTATGNQVIEIYRQGYIHEEQVIRFAEVKVALNQSEFNK